VATKKQQRINKTLETLAKTHKNGIRMDRYRDAHKRKQVKQRNVQTLPIWTKTVKQRSPQKRPNNCNKNCFFQLRVPDVIDQLESYALL